MSAATASSAMAVLPGFVLGAGGVLVRADLGFGTGGLAAILAAFFTTAAGASALGGVLSDRLGARRVLVASAALSAASLLGVAFVARRWADLMVLLVLAGVANGLSQPAANLALARVGQSQGLTFGIKQSGIPMSTLIAGMLVPSVGLAFGWRAVFAGCAVVPVVVAVLAPPDGPPADRAPDRVRRNEATPVSLVILGLATMLGVTASMPVAAFFVESAVAKGYSLPLASGLLTIGSLVGIVGRVVYGWMADRLEFDAYALVGLMLLGGSVGYAVVGLAGSVLSMGIGIVLAYALGWGWSGLLLLAVVRSNPGAAGASTGVVQAGLAAGSAAGPALFGVLVERFSFAIAWWGATIVGLCACALLLLARGLIRARR